MIYESGPWRNDLIRFARSLEQARKRKWPTDAQSWRIERDIMYGFFAIRKLLESYKLTSVTDADRRGWTAYPAFKHREVPRHKRQDIETFYDLGRPTKAVLSVSELANQVIHSHIFIHRVDAKERLLGVWVASDRFHRKQLLYLEAWRIAKLYMRVAQDQPRSRGWRYDATMDKYHYWNSHRTRA